MINSYFAVSYIELLLLINHNFFYSAPKRLPAVPESVLKRRKARSAFKLKQLKKAIEVC